jgi:hypothetical protein
MLPVRARQDPIRTTGQRHRDRLRTTLSRFARLLLVGACCAAPLLRAEAQPAEIIILRHAEKVDNFRLCPSGTQRSLALVAQYLGRDARDSLFAANQPPAAFFAVSLHTLETATPAATSWALPLITYSVLPASPRAFALALNLATERAAHDVLTDPRWTGKTLVMVWEHDHIAHSNLKTRYPGEQVALRQLLHLDRFPGVPRDWPVSNYDYFWIVRYDRPGSDIPTSFRMVRQDFTPMVPALAANAWAAPRLPGAAPGCQR